MTTVLFTRDVPSDTLTTVMDRLDTRASAEALTVNTSDIRIRHADGVISVGTREVPLDEESIEQIAGWVDFPRPFVRRIDNDLRGPWLNDLLQRKPQQVVARVAPYGIVSLREPNALNVEPRRVVEVAAHVLTPEAVVPEWNITAGEFYLDAFHPIVEYGDSKVGDITRAGLRFAQNLHQNLAPKVQPWTYRLACKNGMQTRSSGAEIDARGSTADELIAELEVAARIAFGQIENDVRHFYELRDERVQHPERLVARLASDHNVSNRIRMRLIDHIPAIVDDDGSASMFDIINLFTNTANEHPSRRGERLALEQFGGSVVSAHVARCRTCSAKLN